MNSNYMIFINSKRGLGVVTTTIIILLVSVVIATGVILFGTSLFQTLTQPTKSSTQDNYWGKNASDTTSINVSPNGQCKWGTNGNQCITAGEYLNYCLSAPRNNITENPLVFCADMMTSDLKPQPVIHPFLEFHNKNGIITGRIECDKAMQVYRNYSITCDGETIIGYVPLDLRGIYFK